MTLNAEQEFLSSYNKKDFDAPLFTVDMAIFSVDAGQLQVLLIKRSNFPQKDQWALPGGFVNLTQDADLMASAHRKLVEKTGLQSPHLEQVATVGNATRDPRGWAVTALYFALIDFKEFQQVAGEQTEHSEWVSISEAKKRDLAFDHLQLLEMAIDRLSRKARYTALPVSLMPKLFTLTELQQIYEIILGQSLEKKSFRRRMVEAGAVEETNQTKIAGKRPAQLYKYAFDNYDFHFPRILEYPRELNPS
ncbi:NUDIX domain-containing protein [Acinetobacter sp.]|uniref:ADPR responsive transcriptional repressor NtrR n=1 Tax=Acinetobacter sp. TaxID=472 RepID=UPI002830524D|nr:NUDIX domain-containing protein [Acinetobacter sp.]MDR0235597.1 NUDIX hydrolase [Acinetobacter sp.]